MVSGAPRHGAGHTRLQAAMAHAGPGHGHWCS
jgi:hypothetical protein